MKQDDYVKVVGVDGNYRFGFIADVLEEKDRLVIDLYDEGESKIAYDAAREALLGIPPLDYAAILTDSEKRVIPLVAAGYITKEIAEALSISPVTVRAHLRTLRLKLHLENRDQLISLAQGIEGKLNGNGAS